MRVGYVRTSKKDQNPDLQRRELEDFGCEKVFEEQVSSRKADRPELHAALDYCWEGDELVVWKLDRFGRSLKELIGEHENLGGTERVKSAEHGRSGTRMRTSTPTDLPDQVLLARDQPHDP